MKVARVVVSVGSVDAGWRVRVTQGDAAIAPERVMRRVTIAIGGDSHFPMPQETIAEAEPHAALCADTTGALAAKLYERVVQRGLDPGDVERYGRWLFDSLLGPASFEAIVRAARGMGADLAEIALRWPASERSLSRLHWEAMRSAAGFLAAGVVRDPSGSGVRITMTRIVEGAAHVPREMASPPRALFVLGGGAGDKELRPGAELLSVLRPLRHGDRSLRGEVLVRATPGRLRDAVTRLEPELVHIVAHGVVDQGACLLELAADEGESDGLRTADQLLAMLTRGGLLPTVVVVSACDAGLALPLTQAGSLASQLVAGGVPIVVGMAGRISDAACRLFARRFGEALLAGEPLVAATEEGRRAAFSDGEPPDRSIDWALPALFLAEGVAPDFGTKTAPDDPIEQRITRYKVAATPVFCGRDDALEALYQILARKEHPVLAIASDGADLGRTRLLKELTAAALRAGHIPVLMVWESPTAAVPVSIEMLARQLGLSIERTRAHFGLKPREASPLALLLGAPPAAGLDALRSDVRLPESLRGHLTFAESLDARAFALGIADELAALARDARSADAAAAAPTLRPASRALVLVDDVHRWDKALEPFLDELITVRGLGTDDEPVPVVLSFSLDGPAATLLRPVAERRRAGWTTRKLERFAPGEDLLAYQQVLLHPFGPVLPKFSDLRWVFHFNVDESLVRESLEAFEDVIAGAPAELATRQFYGLMRVAKASGFVVAAGDEDVLEKLRKGGTS